MNLKELEQRKRKLLGAPQLNNKDIVKMPPKKGESILVMVSKEFIEISNMVAWSTKDLIHDIIDIGKAYAFTANFIKEDDNGNIWVEFQVSMEKMGSDDLVECRIPREAILFMITDPSNKIKKTIGFEAPS